MSLARSASGPGGLTINTGAANSLAPPASQPAGSGGLFGSASNANATSASATGGMTSTAGGLFGGGQQKPAGGLFGSSTTAPGTTGTAGGGLFGGGGTNTQAQTGTAGASAGGGLFGGASNTQQQQQQQGQQQTGGGLFGNAGAQQQKPAGGLFGSTATQPQQQQQPAAGGLFGSSTAQKPAQSTGGLFGGTLGGNTQQQQQQQPQQGQQLGGGLFGQSQAKPAGSLFGAQPQQQAQQAQQGASVTAARINFDNLRPRTRFDDLTKEVQDAVEQIDQHILRVIHMKAEISEFMPQHERDIEQLGRDVTFVESKFKTVQAALNRDVQTVKTLQDMTKKSIADSSLSRSAVDNLQLPTHYHQTGLFAAHSTIGDSHGASASATHASAQDLISYFNRICDDIDRHKRRLDEYRSAIERDMPGVENGLYEQIRTLRDRQRGAGGGAAVQDQLGEILAALRDTGNAIVAQAGQIAETRERLSRLQAGIVDSGVYALTMASA